MYTQYIYAAVEMNAWRVDELERGQGGVNGRFWRNENEGRNVMNLHTQKQTDTNTDLEVRQVQDQGTAGVSVWGGLTWLTAVDPHCTLTCQKDGPGAWVSLVSAAIPFTEVEITRKGENIIIQIWGDGETLTTSTSRWCMECLNPQCTTWYPSPRGCFSHHVHIFI